MADVDDNRNFQCHNCNYASRHFRNILKHCNLVHSLERNFSMPCVINDCPRKYRNVKAFQYHLRTHHKDFYRQHLLKRELGVPPTDYLREVDTEDNDIEENFQSRPDQPQPSPASSHVLRQFDFQKRLGLFMLRLREQHHASQMVCNEVISEIKSIVETNNDILIAELDQTTAGLTHNVHDIIEVQSRVISDAAENVGNPNKLHRFVQDNLQYTSPLELKVNNDDFAKVQ